MPNAQLVLEDGTVFVGHAFGAKEVRVGEVIVQTSMTGYQEILSNPAYANHIVVMTYPLIGNYGLNHDDFESITSFARGLVVREQCTAPSNFRQAESIDSYTRANNISGIEGIDTRKLTHHIRERGSMKGIIVPRSTDIKEALRLIREQLEENMILKEISTARPYVVPGRGKRVVLIDLGAKHGILRALTERDCHVTVVPSNYPMEEIFRLQPDGMIVSNGAGRVSDVAHVVGMLKEAMQTIPIFAIGLGHLLFAVACGAQVRKKKSGRYVTGFPVTHVEHETTHFISIHQSEEIVMESMEDLPLRIVERMSDDGSIAHLQHQTYDAFSVQYDPESAPGPEESAHLFDYFLSICTITRPS